LAFAFAISGIASLSGVSEISRTGVHARQRDRLRCYDADWVRQVDVEIPMGRARNSRGRCAYGVPRRPFVAMAPKIGCVDCFANLRCKFAISRYRRFNPAARNENLSTPGFHSTSPLFPSGAVLFPR